MSILSTIMEDYLLHCSEPEPEHLKRLSEETRLKTTTPHMSSGLYQGRVLGLISKLIRPKYILDIGTFTGYSALCLAEGLVDDGLLITIDIDKKLQPISQKYFKSFDHRYQIRAMHGNALELIPELSYQFDLVFIDADKRNYARYFDLVIEKMSSGGLIISDNVLWSSKVLERSDSNDKHTLAMQSYNEKLQKDPRIETVMFPIRDGLTLSRIK